MIWETITTQTSPKKIEDSLLDLLIMAYIYGVNDVSKSLGEKFEPDTDKMNKSVYKSIAGETWVKRVRDAQTIGELERIFVTESHRCFSEGQWDTAEGHATSKIWHTQEDDKVRETHWYLDNMEVGIDEYFYTLDGDRALKPYGFESAENNINCRCYLEYNK